MNLRLYKYLQYSSVWIVKKFVELHVSDVQYINNRD